MKTIRLNNNYSSETGEKLRFSIENKYEKFEYNSLNTCFYNWFVGFTEGDGCFNIYTHIINKKISLTFSIAQNLNNVQVLYYIKTLLNCGSVRLDYEYNMAYYRVRDQKALLNIIIPIFDNYSMYSSKEFNFINFKKAFDIWVNLNITQEEKIIRINLLKSLKLPSEFIASSWNLPNAIMSKCWIVGFVEAEGSFYLVQKDNSRLVHAFGITQKLDKIILIKLRYILSINCNIKYNKKGFYFLDAQDKKSLSIIKKYFFKTMKGRKSLEYRIWARSFRYKGKFNKLSKIKELLYKIRIKV